MRDVAYELKVMNSKVYGLRDAMVRNAKVFNKFVNDTADNFGIVRKRLTRVERRQNGDRLLIYCLIGRLILDDYRKKKWCNAPDFKNGSDDQNDKNC